jgi:MFS family permease
MKFPESNTPKLLTIATLQGLTFYAAFEKIFFQENGLSIIEIAFLTIVFSITLITLEVPSGALSDRWVRKHVLVLSILASASPSYY